MVCNVGRGLEPVWRAAGAVDRILALRHDALQAHLAGIGEHGRALVLYRSPLHNSLAITTPIWEGFIETF
jgi:hypothetical protein